MRDRIIDFIADIGGLAVLLLIFIGAIVAFVVVR